MSQPPQYVPPPLPHHGSSQAETSPAYGTPWVNQDRIPGYPPQQVSAPWPNQAGGQPLYFVPPHVPLQRSKRGWYQRPQVWMVIVGLLIVGTVGTAINASKAGSGTGSTSGGSGGSFTMPNEVGSGLQDAQDDIQRVSGNASFFTHSHDLLGGRMQILDRDWQVCTQSVSPGRTVGANAYITFGVVKQWESCP